MQDSWPGRPGPQTASSFLLLSPARYAQRFNRHWAAVVWTAGIVAASAIPFVVLVAYSSEAPLFQLTASTGMPVHTAVGLPFLVVDAAAARPDLDPMVWALNRADPCVSG